MSGSNQDLLQPQKLLLPQAYLTNFHNRIRNEDVPMLITAQPVRGHKRAKVVNYAEFDNDILNEFTTNPNSNNSNSNINSNLMNNNGNSDLNNINSNANNMNNDINMNSLNGFNNNLIGNINLMNSLNLNINNMNMNNNLSTSNSLLNIDNHDFLLDPSRNISNLNLNIGDLEGTGFFKDLNNNNNTDDANDQITQSNTNQLLMEDELLKKSLPDIKDQDELINILRYPKIRATFSQSKIATPYRLDISPELSMNQQEQIIIPINLNIEHGDHTIIDSFTWNVNDHSLTPEEFATIYIRDLDFSNSSSLHSQIVSSINEQIQEYETVASVMVPDLHVIINLTCSLENKMYEDNFQWNLTDKSLSPEIFAEIVVQDLGLTREFMPLISNALHEYILKVKKEWLEGQLNQDHVPNGAAFGYLSGLRLDIDELGANWCPRVEELTQEEIQKREIEKERNLRRLKRDADRMGRRGRRRLDNLETSLRL
ncbi:hypothetical protein TBLA_0G01390 [Henningerozyma blattae CBS 6284]|uniref:Chromatin structure-remodeling complex subunit SFH1 n=1 Tax=Henningerozyma blattae (strain ATCC 34711 / CBS 6284 / DSM 70876 / NBRC 10599 / NRRL Y-10934 / UCD 77-7) TaxID=1071380 RepID=I2H6T3_HENB6|nr:hypothetical protein TBLA_0G01390 [Tetrapisispora blattae CBS 6284]CCH62085.1 hypothetical protein TBLA_0G01390 [Tetrapisispora blattae CBS 6284]